MIMNTITGNETVYPVVEMEGGVAVAHSSERGITIRQHFAAMAMQGYMANEFTPHQNPEYVAEYAVKVADALIAELNKPTTSRRMATN